MKPGSPASRFLAPAPVETTIKATAEKPAPAPTAVPDLPAASATETIVQAPKPAAKAAAKQVAKKKSARQLRAEKRMAKLRTNKKSVAAAPAADDDEADAPARKRAMPAADPSGGKGILSIASTPAMEVWVDGRNSKAMTPVRIKLLAGKHKVTLLDKQSAKARSFDVVIKPDETTKVAKSYE